jgi:hypothetical protein
MRSIMNRIESNTQVDARYSGDFWIAHRCQGDDSDEMWTLATYAFEGPGLTQGLYPERTGLRLSHLQNYISTTATGISGVVE